MAVFNKDFNQVTFADIEQMVNEGWPESEVLDYKQSMTDGNNLAKLISAFANTYGGWIVVGVEEKPNTNQPLRIVGLQSTSANVENQIDEYCSSLIDPPITNCRKNILVDPSDPGKKVLLIYIPESDLTPHYVENESLVYVKIGAIKKPLRREEYYLADRTIVHRLTDRRRWSADLKKSLLTNGRNRADGVYGYRGLSEHLRIIVQSCPKYPQGSLTDYWGLSSFMNDHITTEHKRNQNPFLVYSLCRSLPFDDGLAFCLREEDSQSFHCYYELSTWGAWLIDWGYPAGGPNNDEINARSILTLVEDSLLLQLNGLKALNYVGSVAVHVHVENLSNKYIVLPNQPFAHQKQGPAVFLMPISHDYEFRSGEVDIFVESTARDVVARILHCFGSVKDSQTRTEYVAKLSR